MPYQILLVDDDPEFREELRECLGQYRIIEAASGGEALRIIQKPHAIDLVLLDVLMPDLRGTEVLREIRKIAPHLGIIILTAHSSEDVAIDALKGRADDYVEKPFEVDQLRKTIERVLADRKGNTGLPGKMERVKRFLKNNCGKKVSLKDAAGEVCLSPKYLSRIFKEKIGTGFTDYRLKIKTQTAKRLLDTASVSVQEVADRLGYKNLESFVRIFKKITGHTPTAYRRHAKGGA